MCNAELEKRLRALEAEVAALRGRPVPVESYFTGSGCVFCGFMGLHTCLWGGTRTNAAGRVFPQVSRSAKDDIRGS